MKPVKEMTPYEYSEARRNLVHDAHRAVQRTVDQASEQRREKDLAASAESLLDIRDTAIRRGMTPKEAVKFADKIARLRAGETA